jgi:cytochrome d ubiquinol oxidase subunit II
VRRARARLARTWTWANTIGSFGASLLWGSALANLLHGVPIDSDGDYTGDLLDLFSPYTVVAGIAVVLLFVFHGATFLTVKTTGELCRRARRDRHAASRSRRPWSPRSTCSGAGARR